MHTHKGEREKTLKTRISDTNTLSTTNARLECVYSSMFLCHSYLSTLILVHWVLACTTRTTWSSVFECVSIYTESNIPKHQTELMLFNFAPSHRHAHTRSHRTAIDNWKCSSQKSIICACRGIRSPFELIFFRSSNLFGNHFLFGQKRKLRRARNNFHIQNCNLSLVTSIVYGHPLKITIAHIGMSKH